jgi:ribose 5-phosphate isomerase B
MTIYFATDHAGYELKNKLVAFVRDELACEVVDCGAYELSPDDDYPGFVAGAAQSVSHNPDTARAIILGGSGQGEAMVANKFSHVRAAVYYGAPKEEAPDAAGKTYSMIELTRVHNDANVLSLGARFLSVDEAKAVVALWLKTPFSGDERHVRRISQFS